MSGRPAMAWDAGPAPAWWLRALAVAFGAVAGLRRRAYAAGWLRASHPGVPVLVVGNLTAGGSGKTPLVIALVRHLREAGWRPGVASRGHGRRGRGLRQVRAGDDPSRVGDEPLLVAEATGAPVVVAARRAEAARRLVDALGCDLVVADDGLQHLALARDLEIEVVDAARGYGNGRLLPAGPLRERPGERRDCDFRVVNGEGGAVAPRPGDVAMRLAPRALHSLDGGETRPPGALAGQRVHALAGIGHPARFFDTLRDCGMLVIEHAFPDHHAFRPEDLVFDDDLPLVMTDKDAVKCRSFAPSGSWRLEVAAELPGDFLDALDARLAALRAGRPA